MERVGYAELRTHAAQLGQFDLLVCNFAQLEEPLAPTLNALHRLLVSDGRLLIQTCTPGAVQRNRLAFAVAAGSAASAERRADPLADVARLGA